MLSFIARTPLLSMVLGPIAMILVDYLKSAWGWLDKKGPATKQAAAFVVSAILVGLTTLGVNTPSECSQVLQFGVSSTCANALASSGFLQSVLSTLVAIALKHGKQNTGK